MSPTTQEFVTILDSLPDSLLATIMTWTNFGAAKTELTCPAARMACVNKHWHDVYQQLAKPILMTSELRRVSGWSIQEDVSQGVAPGGVGNAQTIVDGWVRPPQNREPHWWTPGWAFRGGPWTGNAQLDSAGGPFDLNDVTIAPPTLVVAFRRPVLLRVLVFGGAIDPV